MSILTPQRKHLLDVLVSEVKNAVLELRDSAPTKEERDIWSRYYESVENTPIKFVDQSVVEQKGSLITRGVNETQIELIKNGNKLRAIKGKHVITIPAKYFFYVDKITPRGIINFLNIFSADTSEKITLAGMQTLLHEWGHFD